MTKQKLAPGRRVYRRHFRRVEDDANRGRVLRLGSAPTFDGSMEFYAVVTWDTGKRSCAWLRDLKGGR